MSYDIGPKIGIEGEAQFIAAIREINTSLKTLGTEMKAVTSAYDNNDRSAEKLTAQNEILNKQIEAQKQKLDELKSMLDKSRAAYGENDAQTQKYKQAVNLATADLNKMERELANNEKALRDVVRGYNDAGQKLDKYGNVVEDAEKKHSSFASVVKGVAAGVAAVAAAAGAAAVSLGKEVISAFADYEQLVGGVETLFKESAEELQQYASNAFKTAGLSANEYMETVTSFSASLIQSLGGDTAEAVKYADMAITDMSDNANKMGTDMQSIMNAYQGFAKQNYTMLDNLKLGYGGTKTEMERLLKDAETISGIHFDISSYADVVKAIHVIQESMGITGTTAKEAEHTISGSINSMKAAVKNWITGLGNADADMQLLTENMAESFNAVVRNIVPVIDNITKALPSAFSAMLPAIASLIPSFVSTATSLFRQVLNALLNMIPELIPVAVAAMTTIADALIDNLPLIINSALTLILTLSRGVVDALPELIPAVVDTMITIVDTLIDNVDMLVDASIAIMMALSEGLIDALPKLIEKAPEIVAKLVDAIVRNAPKLLVAAGQMIITLVQGIGENLSNLGRAALEIVTTIVSGIKNLMTKLWEIGKDIVRGIWDGIKSMGSWLGDQVKGFFSGIVNGIKDFLGIHSPSKVFAGIGENMAAGLGAGFAAEMQNVARQINNSVPTSISPQISARVSDVASAMPFITSGSFVINLMLPDGRTIASTIFDPLREIARQRGVTYL